MFPPELGFLLFVLSVDVLAEFCQLRVLGVVGPDVVPVFYCCANILPDKFAATVDIAFRDVVLVGVDCEVC